MFSSVAAFAESISAPEIGIVLPRLCPELKSGEQYRSVFNEVVGRVHNEVVRRVRRRRPDVRPDLLLGPLSELNESAHALAVALMVPRPVTTPSSSNPQ
jgi:hypothetical protein